MAKIKRKNKNILIFAAAVLLVLISIFSRESFLDPNNNLTLDSKSIGVYFLDVGQGHCTVLQSGNDAVLIDAGEKEYAAKIIDFLEEKGITELKYVIATHPHSDHIGALPAVLERTSAETVYMPYIIDKYAPTSKLYFNLLSAIDRNDINVRFVDKKTSFKLGETEFTVLPPAKQINDFNNMSLITKITYGDVSFLITGDAEDKELKGVMSANKGFDFSADFYLMGHHGSSTSLDGSFLKAVKFSFAVISCGKGNSYGHPHKEALDYLKKNNISFARTDECGTVTVITDGDTYKLETEKGSVS